MHLRGPFGKETVSMACQPSLPVLQRGRKASPALLFGAFLLAGFLLHACANGLLRRQRAQQHLSEQGRQVATAFQAFASTVKTRSDARAFYVESNGIPDRPMMVGITNWQQQVPLPQTYTGQNAWQFPLTPVPAATPLSAQNHFFRGAMAIAADGVPIFNALNNRGEDSYKIGELDQFGGHCGRADDYHYHIAPLHLVKIVGQDKPIAYALDGYALYGLTEPDGSAVGQLDAFNGHTTPKLGYHYHASRTYPYLNGGFHGEVVERGGQVDPQPRAQPIRPDTRPLRGAKITGFEKVKSGSYSLTYTLDGEKCKVNYTLQTDGSVKFDYVNGQGNVQSQTYAAPRSGGRGPNGPPRGEGGPQPERGADNSGPEGRPAKEGTFVLRSPAVSVEGLLPVEFTGDGSSISPPLEWSGAPAATRSYVVIMHHIDPQKMVKWYWTLYNIPMTTHGLPKNAKGIGTMGTNSVSNRLGYAPPHSKGPGPKTYILTVYALAEPLKDLTDPYAVNRASLLAAMQGKVLASAELKVVYTSKGTGDRPGGGPPRPEDGNGAPL
jgi:Raf kinase inhibitor-like YbhB/YbcL family protein